MSEQERVQEYLEVFRELKTVREPWERLWEEITSFVLPSRDMWEENESVQTREVKKGKDIFDSRPVADLQTLANSMVGYNAGPASPWFRLRMAVEELDEIPFVRDWLEDGEKRLYVIFSVTNFYTH